MEIRKKLVVPEDTAGKEREYRFFTVRYNHFRDVSTSASLQMRDREEIAECECVLCLPDSYTATGEETQLILSFHGAGSRVCAAENMVGGLHYVQPLMDAGCAVLDVNGSETDGITMGCPEHLFAAYKAYRYAVRRYNLSERVLVAGASMGGQTAMNFVNMFPSISIAAGLIYPRLHMDGFHVGEHYCIGTWDKTEAPAGRLSTHQRMMAVYHMPDGEWSEETTRGFNPYKTRSFINGDGERVVIPPCPIKIWQGTADKTVDPLGVESYVQSVRRSGSYIEYRLLENVGHELIPVMFEELLLWFKRFL